MDSTENDLVPIRPYKLNGLPRLDKDFELWHSQYAQKLIVEIGCGVGLHPIKLAQSKPDYGVLAFERTKNKFQSFARRLHNHPQIKNIYAVNQDAQEGLLANFAESSVDQFYLLYPNPYPKESQANKRWHRNPFMHHLQKLLKPEGRITIATNEAWLKEETLKYMQKFWRNTLVQLDELTGPSSSPLTHFEKKYLARGDTCYHMVFSK